jgi:eukaryotic translation initiation factor 2C
LEGGIEFKDHDPLPLISALNLVLQQHASTVAIRFGKNRYFLPPNGPKPALSPALDAWRGYYSSIRPAHMQLMVNVNVCMTAFYHGGSLMDALEAFRQRSSGAMPTAFPQKLKVITNHLGYPMKKQMKKIVGNPTNTVFDCAEFGGKISVAAYFLKSKRFLVI